MDQTQQRALNALEPYIALARAANNPQAAAQVVVQAISAPNTFVFAELLQAPNIKQLQKAPPEQASYYTLLQIFSWGTWSDYTSLPNLPRLSQSQAQKLKQLSLITLSNTPSLLTYQHLRDNLALPSNRALEDLVISAMYAGLITGKLDTLSERVALSSVAPLRDLKPGSVPSMSLVLKEWDERCVSVLNELEGQIRDVRSKAAVAKKRADANEKATAKLMEDKDNPKGKSGGKRAVGEENEEMEIDEGNAGTRTRNAKRGGALFKGFGRKLG